MSTKECKAELRGHEHVVECVAWAPDVAVPHIADAAGMQVRPLGSNVKIARVVLTTAQRKRKGEFVFFNLRVSKFKWKPVKFVPPSLVCCYKVICVVTSCASSLS